MKTSAEWISYFNTNLQQERIDWSRPPAITAAELKPVLKSLQAWQLGESCEGHNLIRISEKYAAANGDALYVEAVRLFIKEEKKHGSNLGKYLDAIEKPRIKTNWFDTLFRNIRNLNDSMEMWTLAVVAGESAAQIFYQSLKNATKCLLLQQICNDILIDEAPHVKFQQQRLAQIFVAKTVAGKAISFYWYKFFFKATSIVVWMTYRNVFKAGGNNFKGYYKKMNLKLEKTIGRLKYGMNDTNLAPSYSATI
jgi:hypothetical protein